MYIPLGGSAWRALNIWPIFLFVALWHDLEPRLLHWGLIMPAAMLPELVRRGWGRGGGGVCKCTLQGGCWDCQHQGRVCGHTAAHAKRAELSVRVNP
jgi:hypothetical protein